MPVTRCYARAVLSLVLPKYTYTSFKSHFPNYALPGDKTYPVSVFIRRKI